MASIASKTPLLLTVLTRGHRDIRSRDILSRSYEYKGDNRGGSFSWEHLHDFWSQEVLRSMAPHTYILDHAERLAKKGMSGDA